MPLLNQRGEAYLIEKEYIENSIVLPNLSVETYTRIPDLYPAEQIYIHILDTYPAGWILIEF